MLARNDLWSLEEYSQQRAAFRNQVLAHKENRRVVLGGHILLTFEDALTVKYQVQEMLRIEKVFETAGIQDELDAYNPLIPDGNNWKCSMLIQYEDVVVRKQRLQELVGVEQKVWVKVGDCERLYPVADEDLERASDEKTSAVHFLRYQLTEDMCAAARQGQPITFGVEHEAYSDISYEVPEAVRASLAADIG